MGGTDQLTLELGKAAEHGEHRWASRRRPTCRRACETPAPLPVIAARGIEKVAIERAGPSHVTMHIAGVELSEHRAKLLLGGFRPNTV